LQASDRDATIAPPDRAERRSDEVLPEAVHVVAGTLRGEIAADCNDPAFVDWLASLPSLIRTPGLGVLGTGRNRHVVLEAPLPGGPHAVVVKSFGRLSLLKDLRDQRRGSKARRTWIAARHLRSMNVGTPAPIGYVERWQRGRLVESYYIARYEAQALTLRDAMQQLFASAGEITDFNDLLQRVAREVRAMHDGGFVHLDLGPRNVLVSDRSSPRWRDVTFVDLNRGRIRPDGVSLRERALDTARLALPSHLQRLFVKMYWDGHPPEAIWRWDRVYRRRHRWRVRSRRWRHPIREARVAREGALREASGAGRYPAIRDMWIWDERPAQPIALLLSEDRGQHIPRSRSLRMIFDTLRMGASVMREYRPLIAGAFREPVPFADRIGMCVDGTIIDPARELALLAALGPVPALVRFGHHEPRSRRRDRIAFARSLHAAGHRVAVTLSQDRSAVLQPASWREYLFEIVGELADIIDYAEIGRSVNRVKWGIWSFHDLASIYAPVAELSVRHPGVRLIGPAAIDFDYAFIPAALREWPANVKLAALSHQLYVDRRGAPENPQSGFAAIEKFALARAIARASPLCNDALVITEVNWSLQGTGAHSPVGSPYEFEGQRDARVAVDEDDYADYMLRYLCLAIGSGLVDRVYWWRLVARGFGLVDDTDARSPRPRAAYDMLRHFLGLLGRSTMVGAQLPPREGRRHGRYRLAFRRPDGETVVVLYAHGPSLAFASDESFSRVEDAFGMPIDPSPQWLTGRPVYLRNARA
jgi:tRNA A-37 threonylcarbamoyl transferase component Bud32